MDPGEDTGVERPIGFKISQIEDFRLFRASSWIVLCYQT